jgi:hypothetical protein
MTTTLRSPVKIIAALCSKVACEAGQYIVRYKEFNLAIFTLRPTLCIKRASICGSENCCVPSGVVGGTCNQRGRVQSFSHFQLLGLARSGVYRAPGPADTGELTLMRRIDELFSCSRPGHCAT